MAIIKNRHCFRDPDGNPVCHCGCGQRLLADEKIECVLSAELTESGPLIKIGEELAAWIKTSCIEFQPILRGTDLDRRKAELVALAHSDRATLQKLYIFMHDALGCRV